MLVDVMRLLNSFSDGTLYSIVEYHLRSKINNTVALTAASGRESKHKISSIHNKNFWFEISNIVKILPDLDRSCRILADLAGV